MKDDWESPEKRMRFFQFVGAPICFAILAAPAAAADVAHHYGDYTVGFNPEKSTGIYVKHNNEIYDNTKTSPQYFGNGVVVYIKDGLAYGSSTDGAAEFGMERPLTAPFNSPDYQTIEFDLTGHNYFGSRNYVGHILALGLWTKWDTRIGGKLYHLRKGKGAWFASVTGGFAAEQYGDPTSLPSRAGQTYPSTCSRGSNVLRMQPCSYPPPPHVDASGRQGSLTASDNQTYHVKIRATTGSCMGNDNYNIMYWVYDSHGKLLVTARVLDTFNPNNFIYGSGWGFVLALQPDGNGNDQPSSVEIKNMMVVDHREGETSGGHEKACAVPPRG